MGRIQDETLWGKLLMESSLTSQLGSSCYRDRVECDVNSVLCGAYVDIGHLEGKVGNKEHEDRRVCRVKCESAELILRS